MILNNIKHIALGLAAVVTMSACVGDLDVDPGYNPKNVMTYDQEAAFAKVYANLALTGQKGPSGDADIDAGDEGTSGFVRLVWNAQELPTDEAICSWGDGGVTTLNNATWTASNEFIGYLYYRLAFGITLANDFLQKTATLTDATTVQQQAEVRFLRALYYYYFMDCFANVPFTTTVERYEKPKQVSRDSVYNFIESELLAIESQLAEPLTNTYGRVDKAAVWLLLSRLYLNAEVYTGNAQWQKAYDYAKLAMNSGYTLAPVYRHLFMADNNGSTVNQARQEIILPILQQGDSTQSYAGSTFLIASTHGTDMSSTAGITSMWSGNRARPNLVEKFFGTNTVPEGDYTTIVAAAGDDRALFYSKDRTLSISNTGSFAQGLSVCKWSGVRADGGATTNSTFADTDVPFLRLAEAYLNFAEASVRLNGGSTTEAIDAINALRSRANATTITTLTLDYILDERAREFYFEGHRRTDLIRFGLFGGYNASYVWSWKGGVQEGTNFESYRNIYPLPTNDINVNSNLKQNTGYN